MKDLKVQSLVGCAMGVLGMSLSVQVHAESAPTAVAPPAAVETAAPIPAAATADSVTATEPAPPHHGLFGALRLGPTVSIGFPFLLNYSVDATWDRSYGVAVGGGRLRRNVGADGEIEVYNWDIRGRWMPWQGSFFVGAAYGKQGIVGKSKTTLKFKESDVDIKVPTTLRLAIDNTYLTPHIGWLASWDSGFTLGFEIGYQLPLSSDAKLQTGFENVASANEKRVKESGDYRKKKDELEKLAESFGKTAVPYVNLIRLGWMF